MDIFKSDKAPYILGLLITVIGWHVSQFVNEITRTQAVSYSLNIDRETQVVVADIRNMSRTKSLKNATFGFTCLGGEHCLAPIETPEEGVAAEYGDIRTFPPNLVRPVTRANSPRAVSFISTVAAGGRYAIVGRLARPDSRLEFYYVPDPDEPLDIFIYKRNTVTGFVVEHYFRMLMVSFGVCLLALFYSILIGFRSAVAQSPTANEDRKE